MGVTPRKQKLLTLLGVGEEDFIHRNLRQKKNRGLAEKFSACPARLHSRGWKFSSVSYYSVGSAFLALKTAGQFTPGGEFFWLRKFSMRWVFRQVSGSTVSEEWVQAAGR